MQITITGNLGSGKSTVCAYLKEHYPFQVYSTGAIQRKLAREMNMSILEFNQYMKTDPQFDYKVDHASAEISRECGPQEDIVFDSRLAWHFVPKSFKVFLFVHPGIAARRVMGDNRGATEQYADVDDALAKLAARAMEERERYQKMYQIDYFDFANYDMIVDTSYCAPEMVAELIVAEAKRFYQAEGRRPLLLLSPRILYPTRAAGSLDRAAVDRAAAQCRGCSPFADLRIPAARLSGYYFIADSHEAAAAGLMNRIPLLTVDLIADGDESKKYLSSLRRGDLKDYEAMGDFQYIDYPGFIPE